jgi:hypothetical protein
MLEVMDIFCFSEVTGRQRNVNSDWICFMYSRLELFLSSKVDKINDRAVQEGAQMSRMERRKLFVYY